MLARRFWFGILLVLVCAACDSQSPPATTTPTETWVVAWVQDGDLQIRRPGEAIHALTEDDIMRVVIAPGGEQIAFTRSDSVGENSLWVIGANGEGETQLDTRPYIHQLAWVDAHTLVFTTFAVDELGAMPRNDLYSVDITTGAVTTVEPGGQFSISPDGVALILIDPGAYQTQPGTIRALSLADIGGTQITLLEFPAISSGAGVPFYPTIAWENNQAIRVALPDPDALYYEGMADAPLVTLWRLSLDGTQTVIGQAVCSYFGLPIWSADSTAMVYLRRGDDPNLFTLWTADGDGSNPALYFTPATIGELPQVTWINNTQTFLYRSDNAYWISAPGEPPRRWLDGGEMMLTEMYQVVDSTLVFSALHADTLELRYAELDNPAGVSTLIAASRDLLDFDTQQR